MISYYRKTRIFQIVQQNLMQTGWGQEKKLSLIEDLRETEWKRIAQCEM